MNIVLLNDDFPPETRNSVSEIAKLHADAFATSGHTVWVITTHRTETCPTIIRDGNLVSIPRSYRPSLQYLLSLRSSTINRVLRKELERMQPDAIFAHNIHRHLTYDALRVAAKFTPNVYITMHDAMSFSFGRLATDSYLASKGQNAKLSVLQQMKQVGLQWNPIKNPFVRSRLRYCTKVIAVSSALETALNQNGIGNTTVIHHGIDASGTPPTDQDIEAWKKSRGLDGKQIIFFGGRLRLDKGIAELLAALELVIQNQKNVYLCIAGEDKRWNEVVAHLRPCKEVLAHCVCTGWLSQSELEIAFHAANVVTTPSMCLDTFNLMNLQAMKAAKPVVGTIFGGTPEIVVDGQTGFI